VQALEVKGTPEALRQATGGVTDGSSHDSTPSRSNGTDIGAVRNHAESDSSHPPGAEPLEKGEDGSFYRLTGMTGSARSGGEFSRKDSK